VAERGLIFLLALPAIYLVQRVLLRQRVELTHRETFTLGFLWYAGLPLLLSGLDIELGLPALRGWQSIATMMGPDLLQKELIWGVGVWAAFIAGAMVVPRAAHPDAPPPDAASPMAWRVVLVVLGTAALVFAVAWGIANHGLLFTGYEATEFDDVVRGPLQAALLYTSIAAIIAIVRRRSIGNLPVVINVAAVMLMMLLSLSIGTRGATILVVVALVALASRLRDGLRRSVLIGSSLLMLAFFAALAAWRLGSSDVGVALLSPALESLFTYFSAATYFAFNDIPLFAFPARLLGAIGNLVPRALWPGKVDFLNSLLDDVDMFAPLGATHLFPSLLFNFGWLGSLVVVFATGAGVERLSRSRRPASIAAWALIVGMLTTDVWRSPFSISLIKTVLQGAVLIPLLLTFLALVATHFRGSARRKSFAETKYNISQ
jgi:hypothetical protein